jgi:hypothetical protein
MAKRESTIGKGKPEASIRVFASGGLIGNIKRLSRMACAERLDEFDRTCLIVSAFLNAGAAIEATLMDYAARTNMPGYNREFGSKSVWAKYEAIKPGGTLEADFPEVVRLWDGRNALSHHEPDDKRSRWIGADLKIEAVENAHTTMLAFLTEIWGGDVPQDLLEAADVV